MSRYPQDMRRVCRMQRKSVLQPAFRASCSLHVHVLANKSFQLAPKPFLISRIDCNPSVIWISPKNSTCPSGKLSTKITSAIAKSTSPRLSDTTFFAHWFVSGAGTYRNIKTQFVWELKKWGFVKAAVSRAVHIGECPFGELSLKVTLRTWQHFVCFFDRIAV